jgi:D-ribose pyranose/furanose isomerase RbsD
MFNGEILNRAFLDGLATMGHRDMLMVVDAGFPVPNTGCIKVELAITKDLPDVETTLKLLTNNMIYEECFASEELKKYNLPLFEKVSKYSKEMSINLSAT